MSNEGITVLTTRVAILLDLVENLKQTAVEIGPAMAKVVHALTKLRADLKEVHHRPHTSADVGHIQVSSFHTKHTNPII